MKEKAYMHFTDLYEYKFIKMSEFSKYYVFDEKI